MSKAQLCAELFLHHKAVTCLLSKKSALLTEKPRRQQKPLPTLDSGNESHCGTEYRKIPLPADEKRPYQRGALSKILP
jgi:hypothetical protein